LRLILVAFVNTQR